MLKILFMVVGMCIKSLALVASVLSFVSTAASADIITETYTGQVGGNSLDSAGYFGGGELEDLDFAATYVFNTGLSGAGISTQNSQTTGTYGGTSAGYLSPAISASLTINGKTVSVPTSNVFISETYIGQSGTFNAGALVNQTVGSYSELLNNLSTTDPNAPVLTSLDSSFTYNISDDPSATILNNGSFYMGGDALTLDTYSVTFTDMSAAVPEASTWAMMILGFCGLGFIAHRRNSKPAMLAAA